MIMVMVIGDGDGVIVTLWKHAEVKRWNAPAEIVKVNLGASRARRLGVDSELDKNV